MAKNTKITVDGATVKTKGQDLTVVPKRVTMFLAGVLIGIFGAGSLLGGIANTINFISDGELDGIEEIVLLLVIGVGLLGIAYFAFNKGLTQRAVHFDVTNRVVSIGKDTIAFDSVEGVYLRHSSSASLGDISGNVIQTGIVSNQNTISIASVSKPKQVENMSTAAELIRLYAEHLGYDPKVVGRYEDLLKVELEKGVPVIFPLQAEG